MGFKVWAEDQLIGCRFFAHHPDIIPSDGFID
jgi:hypothetical protein